MTHAQIGGEKMNEQELKALERMERKTSEKRTEYQLERIEKKIDSMDQKIEKMCDQIDWLQMNMAHLIDIVHRINNGK